MLPLVGLEPLVGGEQHLLDPPDRFGHRVAGIGELCRALRLCGSRNVSFVGETPAQPDVAGLTENITCD